MSATWNNEKPTLFWPKSRIDEWIGKTSLRDYGNSYTKETDTAKMSISQENDIIGFLLSVAYDIRPFWDSILGEYVYRFCAEDEKCEREKMALVKQAILYYAELGFKDRSGGINNLFISKGNEWV